MSAFRNSDFSACEPELAINPWLHCFASFRRRNRSVATSNLSTPLASQHRVHQCIGDALESIIPTSTRVVLPRLSNHDPELGMPMTLKYWQTSGNVAAQLAAKKKQSSNSSCVASVLLSDRK